MGLLKKKLGHQHGTGLHMPWESVRVMEEKSGHWNYVYPSHTLIFFKEYFHYIVSLRKYIDSI